MTIMGPEGADSASDEGEGGGRRPALDAGLSAALGERRRWPRIVVDLPCTVFTGRHVWDAMLRDVSDGGAMLRGVPGLVTDDLLLIRLVHLPDTPVHARVRGVSLIGTHIAIEEGPDIALWIEALRNLPG